MIVTFIVNGKEHKRALSGREILRFVCAGVLEDMGYRESKDDWELRAQDGTVLNLTHYVDTYINTEGVTLTLNPVPQGV